MKYYPVFLKLNAKKAVVIGGGKIAERKARVLIKAGASVKIISPAITKPLERLKKKGLLAHVKRNYRKGDLKDAFIVIAGTSSVKTNSKIARDARYLGIPGSVPGNRNNDSLLINIIDTPSEGNFIAPSIVKRGPLTIAISTTGCSPAVSKTIRKELEKLYGNEFTHYLRLLEKIRKKAMKEIKNDKKREEFLKKLASEKIFNALRRNGPAGLSRLIHHRFKAGIPE
ncbi:MAG: bifunctional precorrin-2 dehydrogenase/sirohydrochlorin ferrochelatase [Candidatus Mariimomonas ferrooxydans]